MNSAQPIAGIMYELDVIAATVIGSEIIIAVLMDMALKKQRK